MQILSLQRIGSTLNNNNGKEDTIKEEETTTIKLLSETESKMNTPMKLIKDYLGINKLIELQKQTRTTSILSLNGIKFIMMITEELQILKWKRMGTSIIIRNIEMQSLFMDMKILWDKHQ